MRRASFVFIGVMACAAPAHSEPDFPAAIQKAAGIPCPPPCALCHTTTPGTAQSATKAFVKSMLETGEFRSGKPDKLAAVVKVLRDKAVDTDHDGKLDVDELASGSDPSSSDPDADVCGPSYGCGAHVARVLPPNDSWAPSLFASALALALLSRMSRSRRSRP